MKLRALALAAMLLSGCDSKEEPAAPAAPAAKPEAAKPAEKAPPKTFSPEDLANAERVALVPSPAEMERSLARAGVEKKLASMVDDKPISMEVENKDQVAVRAGVVLADLVLTVKESSTERTLQRLDSIKVAVTKLGGGTDVPAQIDELKSSIATGELTPDDLIREFDELSQVMVPELEYEAGEWVVPLIQAGSWLEGAHLVSGAVKGTGKHEAAGNLLRQPVVVNYFIEYVEREGGDKAPDEVVDQLKKTLSTLKEVAEKPEFTPEDVVTIHDTTGKVLSLL
jgi:hypothetical protein